MSFEHICKYYDVVLFGASERGVTLPGTYQIEMKNFVDDYKKEVAENKKKGLLMKAKRIHSYFPFTGLLQIGFETKIINLAGYFSYSNGTIW